MEDRVAIIDLGTNTFHLLIVKCHNSTSFTILDRQVIPVKIGAGGINQGHITPEAYQRGTQALQDFNTVIIQHGARLVKIVGTSALRNAENAPDFLHEAEVLLNCPITLIDGDEEAGYIYQGVNRAVGLGQEPFLILDIGGGSVEFILGDQQELYWKKSLEIGAARLIDRFPHDFPVSETQKQDLIAYLQTQLEPLLRVLNQYELKHLAGASGFFETFVKLHLCRAGEESPPEAMPLHYTLNLAQFRTVSNRILGSSREELYNMPGMEAFRAEMMVVSTLLLEFILEQTGIAFIHYADYAVKEGVLVSDVLMT